MSGISCNKIAAEVDHPALVQVLGEHWQLSAGRHVQLSTRQAQSIARAKTGLGHCKVLPVNLQQHQTVFCACYP